MAAFLYLANVPAGTYSVACSSMPNVPLHKGGSVPRQWIVLRFVQYLNAASSIVSTEVGNVSSVNWLQDWYLLLVDYQ